MQGIEPLFQELRMAKIWPHLPERGVLVDFGCDFEQTLIKRLRSRMDKVIGLDIVVKSKRQGNMELIKTDLTKKTSLKNSVADVVTMLAVLEHLPNPEMSVKEAYRLLKPGGVFLVTVPAAKSESILPTLARFGIVRQDMIDQHENYFTHEHLRKLAKRAGFKRVEVSSWEFGFNTFMKAVK
jgi:ubiquinone/menaquinone biosynthesis C-methylase UbiE